MVEEKIYKGLGSRFSKAVHYSIIGLIIIDFFFFGGHVDNY